MFGGDTCQCARSLPRGGALGPAGRKRANSRGYSLSVYADCAKVAPFHPDAQNALPEELLRRPSCSDGAEPFVEADGGHVCAILAPTDFGKMFAWAEELRSPGGS